MTINAYKKEIIKEFARVRQLTSSFSHWIKKTNTDKVWLCESVGNLKGVGQLAIAKTNELRIQTRSELSSIPAGASELISFGARSDRFWDSRSPEIPSRGFLLFFPVGVYLSFLFARNSIFLRWRFTVLLLSWGTTHLTLFEGRG